MLNIFKPKPLCNCPTVTFLFANLGFKSESWRGYSKDFNVMSKFLHKGNKKRSTWHTTPERPEALPLPCAIARGPQSNKRVVVLNKLFMKHITDLMATGKGSEQISGMGLEVTKVKVGNAYNVVNVYWTASGNTPEEKIIETLKSTAGYLRHELTNLRVIGKVPEIQFVRDRSIASWSAVEAILATADFGEDYEPKGVNSFKSDFENQDTQQMCALQGASDTDEDLPPMRQNVLGLDRADIMDRLTAAMKGKQAIPTRHCKSPPDAVKYEPFDEAAFAQFLLQRKIMQDRISKESRREPRLDNINYESDDESSSTKVEEDDYIDEDDDYAPYK